MQKEKIKVYTYTRVSTAMQVDGYSLDAQKAKMKAYADYNDFINRFGDGNLAAFCWSDGYASSPPKVWKGAFSAESGILSSRRPEERPVSAMSCSCSKSICGLDNRDFTIFSQKN